MAVGFGGKLDRSKFNDSRRIIKGDNIQSKVFGNSAKNRGHLQYSKKSYSNVRRIPEFGKP